MDDLEVNPLHKAFLTKFRREFEIACKKSYLIAIPRSDTLENYQIDNYFANSHILIPSKLLKMHYNPSQVGTFEDIELENKKLICTRSTRSPHERQIIRILAEEIGYNVYGKDYKMVLISEPLVAAHQHRPMTLSLRAILGPLSPRSPSLVAKRRRAHLIRARALLDHEDCAKYLEFISQELTVNLENDVKRFQTNYIILAHYLVDAAERTRGIVERYVCKYELALGVSAGGSFEMCDTIRRTLRLALENYILYLMHGKLLVAIQNNYRRADERLARKLELVLASKLSICQLGAQKDFSGFSLNDDLMRVMRCLPSLQSPLAMVSCLVKLVDLISDALNQSVRFKRMLGDSSSDQKQTSTTTTSSSSSSGSSSGGGKTSNLTSSSSSSSVLSGPTLELEAPIPICSDDLIASFVFCLPQVRPSNLYSTLRYLELFGWSSTERDLTAYYLATFESAVEHILHFGNQNTRPRPQPHQTTRTTRESAADLDQDTESWGGQEVGV